MPDDAHGHTDRRGSQGGRIVDPVAHHGNPLALRHHRADDRHLFLGHHLGVPLVHAHGLGHSSRHDGVITGHHHRASRTQIACSCSMAVALPAGPGLRSPRAPEPRRRRERPGFGPLPCRSSTCFSPAHRAPAHPSRRRSQAADGHLSTRDLGHRASTPMIHQTVSRGHREVPRLRRFDHRAPQLMFRKALHRRRQPQHVVGADFPNGTTEVTTGRPPVSVPVLSKATRRGRPAPRAARRP